MASKICALAAPRGGAPNATHLRRDTSGMKSLLLPFAIAICLTLVSPSAHAYIDPNAGGLLFQLLAPVFAALVGAWLFLRQWISAWARRLWRRLTGRGTE